MKILTYIFFVLTLSINLASADTQDKMEFREHALFSKSSPSSKISTTLTVNKSDFSKELIWNYSEKQHPPLAMSKAIKIALDWAHNNYSSQQWSVKSSKLVFSSEFEFACVYVVKVTGRAPDDTNKYYLPIGVSMDERLILPVLNSL